MGLIRLPKYCYTVLQITDYILITHKLVEHFLCVKTENQILRPNYCAFLALITMIICQFSFFLIFPSIHHGGVSVIISGYKCVSILVDPLSYPTSSFQLQHVNDYILEEQRTSFNGLQKNHKVLLGLPLLVASSALPLVIVCITLLLTLNYHVSSLLFSFVVYFCSCHKCLFSTLSN